MHKSFRGGLLAAAAALTVGVLTGCSAGGTSPTPGSTDASTTPVEGGTLVYVESGVTPSAIPAARSTFQEANVRHQLVDQLLYIDPSTSELKPWIATSWTSSADATQFTFKLRSGVTYSDGTPVDAENVKHNLDYFGEGQPDKGIPAIKYLRGYEGSKAIDDSTVEVDFNEPNSGFLASLGVPDEGLLSDAYFALSAQDQADFSKVIGSGPFTVASYTPNKEIVLKKRGDYGWAPGYSSNQGPAHVDEVDIQFATDPSVRAGLVTSGQGDLVRGIAPSDEQSVASGGGQVLPVELGVGAGTGIWLRPGNAVTSDLAVRQAIEIGFDRDAIVNTVLSSAYHPAKSVLDATSFGFKDESSALAYDPEKAKQLLDADGWAPGSDGIRVKGGQRLSLVVSGSAQGPAITQVFQAIAQQLKEIGVDLDVSHVGDQTFWVSSQKDASVPAFSVRVPTPDGLYELGSWSNDYLLLKGSDATIEGLLTQQLSTTDASKQADLIGQLQDYLIQQALVVPIYDEVQEFAASARVHGATFTPTAHPNLQAIWLSSN